MVKLGDKVKDTVSGFEGIAITKHTYLHGPKRVTVQPPIHNGELRESETFYESQLCITTSERRLGYTKEG